MKYYDTTFFFDEGSYPKLSIRIENSRNEGFPITIKIFPSTEKLEKPSVTFFLRSIEDLKSFKSSLKEIIND